MRERHLFWDVAPVLLLTVIAVLLVYSLVDNYRRWGKTDEILKTQATLVEQNQNILALLSDGVKVRGGAATPRGGEGPNTRKTGDDSDLPPGVKPPDIPAHLLVFGDENADDGDWFTNSTMSEPKSLNPIIDNDSAAASLFGIAHDNLANLNFNDLTTWEPRLARAWTRELICRAYVKGGNAEALAQEIAAKWNGRDLASLQIKRIAAEGEVLVLEIADVKNMYREKLRKDFGERIEPQWWFYISYEGQEFKDGTKITPQAIAAKAEKAMKEAAGFQGRVLPSWAGDERVILRILGDEGARHAAEAGLKALEAAPDNRALIIDEKAPSGKREDRCVSYEYCEDYLAQEMPVFTFFLRKDVKWHDGQPFTGKDVTFTFRTVMDPRIECPHLRNYYNDCESCELVDNDPYVVRFTWRRPYFRAFTFSAGMDIVAEHIYRYDDPKQFNEGPQNQRLVGDGAYRLDHWKRGEEFVYLRNEQYYRTPAHFYRLITRVVKDPAAELKLLEAGEIDEYNLLPSQMRSRENDPSFQARFQINISIANVYRYIGWNARLPLFQDKRVRQALTMLVDRERICKDIYFNYALPCHGTVHPENPAYWKEQDKLDWPYDPERAKRQLAEAGWRDTDGDGVLDKDGQPFKFALLIRSGIPEFEKIANLIKDAFRGAGIQVVVNNLEWSAMLEKVERLKFDAVLLGWQLGGLEEDPYQLWHSSQVREKGSNFCYFVSKDADRLIERSRRELDEETRYKYLVGFQKILLEEQPYTFLFVPKRLVAMDKRIQNVRYKLIGSNSDHWWVRKAEQKHPER